MKCSVKTEEFNETLHTKQWDPVLFFLRPVLGEPGNYQPRQVLKDSSLPMKSSPRENTSRYWHWGPTLKKLTYYPFFLKWTHQATTLFPQLHEYTACSQLFNTLLLNTNRPCTLFLVWWNIRLIWWNACWTDPLIVFLLSFGFYFCFLFCFLQWFFFGHLIFKFRISISYLYRLIFMNYRWV